VLADDVKLHQSSHPPRVGRADVGLFFTLYAKIGGASLAPAWLEGREVIAVFEDRADPKTSYIMWLEWRNGRISFICDYRYVRYVTADAELTLSPQSKRADGDATGFSWCNVGSVRKMSDDREYVLATPRNRDFILNVLRDVCR
jgi:hypothetical protein